MAIIDPDGLFSGERLAACSDLAQLYWPRFFLAANGCARLELSYKSLVSRVFGNFQKIPTSEEIWQIFREYEANYLAVLYETEQGAWWCQFYTSEKYLPKYKKTRDAMSPSPQPEVMDVFRFGYLQWKKSKSFQNQSFQKLPQTFSSEGVGIGVGIGVGVGEKHSPRAKRTALRRAKKKQASPPTKTDVAKTRHAEFKVAIFEYWKSKNPDLDCPWAAPEGMQLEMWLKASPNVTLAQFKNMLRNRYRSPVNHANRPSQWLRNVSSWANGLADDYGKLVNGGNGHGNGKLDRAAQAYRDAEDLFGRSEEASVGSVR
jgi:hypothetical protein